MFYMFKNWLGLLNFFILQWFFIRLQRTMEINEATRVWVTVKWDIIGPIVPMTGWWTNYKYLYKRV